MRFGSDSVTFLSLATFAMMLSISDSACAQPAAPEAKPRAEQRRAPASGASTAFGFTAFPYDFTLEAVQKTQQIVEQNGTLYAIHLDNGIPWDEALSGKPFPEKVKNEWNVQIPKGHKVYVALGFLATDRKSLAPPSEGSRMPREMEGAALDDPVVKKAYLNYARRAIEKFNPDFLNLGIEAGEIAHRTPKKWPQFVALYDHVRSSLKADYPDLQIGISFNLQTLMEAKVAKLAKPLVDNSDYLGLSFYPYASEFSEKFGARALPFPPGQWREPLAWAAAYTDKPVALCETGYSTNDVSLPVYNVNMKGDADLQRRYVTDLGTIARDNGFLFVVWFLPIDYDALYEKMPEGDGSNRIWRNIGLLDGKAQPKPAFEAWQRVVDASKSAGPAEAPRRAAAPRKAAKRDHPRANVPGPGRREPAPTPASSAVKIGFATDSDLFIGPPHDSFTLENTGPEPNTKSIRWSYTYEKGRWQWCTRDLREGILDGRKNLAFWVKSDREGPIFLQLVEKSGEAFFVMVTPSTDWSRVEFELSSFEADPAKRQDGRLDAGGVVKILLADSSAVSETPKGQRSIWLADLQAN